MVSCTASSWGCRQLRDSHTGCQQALLHASFTLSVAANTGAYSSPASARKPGRLALNLPLLELWQMSGSPLRQEARLQQAATHARFAWTARVQPSARGRGGHDPGRTASPADRDPRGQALKATLRYALGRVSALKAAGRAAAWRAAATAALGTFALQLPRQASWPVHKSYCEFAHHSKSQCSLQLSAERL